MSWVESGNLQGQGEEESREERRGGGGGGGGREGGGSWWMRSADRRVNREPESCLSSGREAKAATWNSKQNKAKREREKKNRFGNVYPSFYTLLISQRVQDYLSDKNHSVVHSKKKIVVLITEKQVIFCLEVFLWTVWTWQVFFRLTLSASHMAEQQE